MYRQGDVLLVPVESRPKVKTLSHVPRKRGEGIILAAGEATGHHHRVRALGAREYRNETGQRFLTVGAKGATITHEEHDDVPLPPGMFEVVQQREYNPVIKEKKVVQRTTRQVYD